MYRDEFWRDPWVFADPDGDGWHMLVTARAREGELDNRGVLGHAWSPDLVTWQVRAPRSRPGSGFDQLEVAQTAVVDGRPVLIFSCLGANLSAARRAPGTMGGVWALACDDLRGPFDVPRSTLLLDERFYSARLVLDRSGSVAGAGLPQPRGRRHLRRSAQRPDGGALGQAGSARGPVTAPPSPAGAATEERRTGGQLTSVRFGSTDAVASRMCSAATRPMS